MKPNEFSVGDKVVCISRDVNNYDGLILNHEYIVTEVLEEDLRVSGVRHSWSKTRFRKVEPPAVIPEVKKSEVQGVKEKVRCKDCGKYNKCEHKNIMFTVECSEFTPPAVEGVNYQTIAKILCEGIHAGCDCNKSIVCNIDGNFLPCTEIASITKMMVKYVQSLLTRTRENAVKEFAEKVIEYVKCTIKDECCKDMMIQKINQLSGSKKI